MPGKKQHLFTRFAKWTSHYTGKPATFMLAVAIILIWGISGPFFKFSDTWQLVINTGTTIITFLMVFLIQNTQNRDTEALQIKLDEIIRSLKGARNEVLELEELDDDELDEIRDEYLKLAHRARELEEIRDKKKKKSSKKKS
jgi:low affinity Fe/Cu permease